MSLIRLFLIAGISIAGQVISPFNAHAYIDPNTGGIFFTSVLPIVYGILAAIVVFWKRIFAFIKGVFSRNKKNDS
jgi:hypothetical protein